MKSLTQKINHDLVRIYEQRRNEAFHARDERLSRLYTQFPDLESLDRKLRMAGLDQLLAVFEQEPGQAAQEAASFARIEEERLSFLKRHGIDDGYDQPVYVCRACRDTGRVDGDWCRCRRQIIQEILPAYFPKNLFQPADRWRNIRRWPSFTRVTLTGCENATFSSRERRGQARLS